MAYHYRANADPHPTLFTGMMEETWPNQHRTGLHVEEFAGAAEAKAGRQNSVALAFEIIPSSSSLGQHARTHAPDMSDAPPAHPPTPLVEMGGQRYDVRTVGCQEGIRHRDQSAIRIIG